jgi:hypothetical protein
MRRIGRLISTVPLALLILSAGCDSAEQLMSPMENPAAQFSNNGNNGRAKGHNDGPRLAHATRIVTGHGSAAISSNGGWVAIEDDSHYVVAFLYVAPGTVKKNTTFSADVGDDYTIELTATSANSNESNDVGRSGFKKPVLLYFNTNLIQEADRTGLGVAEVKSNGQLVPVPSEEDGMWLIGTLRHFSGYGPTTDRTDPPADPIGDPL